MKIVGYEKAWGAFLGGGALPATGTVCLALASLMGLVAVPDEAVIAAAILSFVNAVFAGLGAYVPTNSATPTHPDDATVNPTKET